MNSKEQMRIDLETQIRQLTQKLADDRRTYERKIDVQIITIQTHEKRILFLEQEVLSLQAHLKKKEDVEDQLDEALKREQDNQAARDYLQKELEQSTDYILDLEERVYKANKTSLELLR